LSENPLKEIIGEYLNSVVFVADYVQLTFNGLILTAYNLPVVKCGDGKVAAGDCGYRDALCDRIQQLLVSAIVREREKITLGFSDGCAFEISLLPEGAFPEAATYQGKNDAFFAWP
jgi:hypothetical protein